MAVYRPGLLHKTRSTLFCYRRSVLYGSLCARRLLCVSAPEPFPHLQCLILLARGCSCQPVPCLEAAIHHSHQAHHTPVLIMERIKQQRAQRLVWVASRGRDAPAAAYTHTC